MKTISIVIAIGLALAALFFFMRDKGTRADLAEAEKKIAALSNEVAAAEVKVVFLGTETNKLGEQMTKNLQRMASLSNQVAKLTDNLKQSQQEHGTARTELEKQTKKAADGDLRITELDGELRTVRKMLEGRESELARVRDTLKERETELTEFHARLQRSEADVVRLQLDQTDEAALRAQLKRLRQQWPPLGFAKAPTKPMLLDDKGAKALTARLDTKATGYYLQIQPDGTVKLVPSFEAVGATK